MQPQAVPAAAPVTRPGSTHQLIQMTGIQKRFGSTYALRGVDFDLLAGEVHGLLGQNGAGKTTLIKIMAGIETPTAGEFRIEGEPVRLSGVADSKSHGIAVVHQSLSVVPGLTVADNMFLGREARRSRVLLNRKAMREDAGRVLEHFGIPLRPDQIVGSLPFAYRQLLEIAKALALQSKVLILDEPTTSLTKADEPILFNAVREMTARGIGVIYVSHRLNEIMELTDRVTVFRDGENAGSFQTAGTTIPALVEAIVGHAVDLDSSLVPASAIDSNAEVVLQIKEASAPGVRDASLELRKGEVIGLVGTTGSGRTELLETIFGLRPIAAGAMRHNGRDFRPGRPSDAISRGIKLVPEDRHKWGLVLDHDIEHNVAMANLGAWTRGKLLFKEGTSRRRAEELRDLLKVKASSVNARLDGLSGGNQQKVLIGKWLNGSTSILLLDEPTAGVDVGARADIYRIVLDLVKQGTAVLVSSSDYSELMQLCSSFVFVTDGRTSDPVPRSQVETEKQLHEILEASRKAA